MKIILKTARFDHDLLEKNSNLGTASVLFDDILLNVIIISFKYLFIVVCISIEQIVSDMMHCRIDGIFAEN